MAATGSSENSLPVNDEMSREEMLELFLAVTNLVEPDIAYHDDPYPLSVEDVEFSYTTSYWARCGPRTGRYKAYYAVNADTFRSWSTERHLAVITHELTHLTQEFERGAPVHPPSFWREMAFHAQLVIDNWGEIASLFDHHVDLEGYRQEVIEDPNGSTVDKRYETVEERKEEMRSYLAEYRHSPDDA